MGRSRMLRRRRKSKADALADVSKEETRQSAEQELTSLLKNLSPELDPVTYGFATLPKADEFIGLFPIMLFNEAEGVTGVVPYEKADAADIALNFPCKRIILQVNSSLDAVGLVAKVSAILAENDIPANVVSAFHHDHIFVPEGRADFALEILKALSAAE